MTHATVNCKVITQLKRMTWLVAQSAEGYSAATEASATATAAH